MNALNMFHILAPRLHDLENGVEVSSLDENQSKTLVRFLEFDLKFHYGFAFSNCSNIRVASLM